MVTGLRGIPNVQGGVETHAEHLYPLLVKMGCDIEILARSPYYSNELPDSWEGIKIHRLWSPSSSGLEAFLHTFLAVLYAGLKRPDVLHIHAIGPAIMTPLARLLGLKVVVTHHGPDYDREKWGKFARWVLQTGERFGMKWSNQRIVISKVIRDSVLKKFHLTSVLIPNGVVIPEPPVTRLLLDKFKLNPYQYILQVSRIVPEKRQLDLVKAFSSSPPKGWKLVLTGQLVENEAYSKELINTTKENKNIILTDFQTGNALSELYGYAGIFVLPSSHEGLPIALLEALSYGTRVVASNIPANLEIGLPADQYFVLGDTNQLSSRLNHFSQHPYDESQRNHLRDWVAKHYNWQVIAEQTLATYKQAIND